MNFSPISQSMAAENKRGRLNVKRSKFNKRRLSARFTLEISQRIHYDEFSAGKDSPPSNFTRLTRIEKLNLSIVSISTICPPIFSPPFLFQIHRKNRCFRWRRHPKDRRQWKLDGLDDGDRETRAIGIDTAGHDIRY